MRFWIENIRFAILVDAISVYRARRTFTVHLSGPTDNDHVFYKCTYYHSQRRCVCVCLKIEMETVLRCRLHLLRIIVCTLTLSLLFLRKRTQAT
jgi:hypothetical protein